MAIVNAKYEFIMFYVGANGRISKGGILDYTKFQNQTLNIPPPLCLANTVENHLYVFIGDVAFSLQTNLMKPYSQHIYCGRKRLRKPSQRIWSISKT